MKRVILILFFLIIFSSFIFAISKTKNDGVELEVPKKSIVVSQSCNTMCLFITVVDLDTKELVILCYANWGNDLRLYDVVKTGIKIDINSQKFTMGKDAPFKNN